MNLPTKLTLSRIAAIPVIVALFYVVFPYHYLVAGLLFVAAALTDMIDGKIARKRCQVTDLGKLLDPIADKVLACTVLIMEAANGDAMMFFNPPVGVIFTAVIVGREVLIGAFRTIAASKGMILAADKFGKVKTALLNTAIPLMMISEFHVVVKIVGNVVFAAAFVFTVISGANYLIKNRKVLSQQAQKEEKDA
ncbi:MAG: CDP-diacylglycerol--glycerol-3-phosphate 3-phosphatidyltransferase [Clostridia bacterium]|nr:CDP-diacylglycerol--glycerol-3-phosphate 3-phosphatidyltransferase [Clostridia bacterium]